MVHLKIRLVVTCILYSVCPRYHRLSVNTSFNCPHDISPSLEVYVHTRLPRSMSPWHFSHHFPTVWTQPHRELNVCLLHRKEKRTKLNLICGHCLMLCKCLVCPCVWESERSDCVRISVCVCSCLWWTLQGGLSRNTQEVLTWWFIFTLISVFVISLFKSVGPVCRVY